MGERNVRPIEMIPQSGRCAIAAVGESYYVEAVGAICGPRTIQGEHRSVAILLREPSNPYDPTSVAVYVEGRKVAHLSRAHAIEYRALVEEIEARGHYAACAALIRGDGITGMASEPITESGSISPPPIERALAPSTKLSPASHRSKYHHTGARRCRNLPRTSQTQRSPGAFHRSRQSRGREGAPKGRVDQRNRDQEEALASGNSRPPERSDS